MHRNTSSSHQENMMEHFTIIHALCRSALASPTPALRKQVERLRDELAADGNTREAARLAQLLSRVDKTVEILPTKVSRSFSAGAGEPMTRSVKPPVDRETSAALAEIIFAEDITDCAPIFSEHIQLAIDTTIEEWAHWKELQAVDIQPAQTCLLYGAPGTGKTELAKSFAKTLGLPIVVARIDGLISSFLGTTARNIGNLFTFANRYQCVLLLDEFDSIAKLRDDPQEVGEIKRVVNALLQNLDIRGNRGLTVGITNHPNLLDPAIWRRFEIQLEVPSPSFEVRKRIASRFITPLAVPDSHLRLIAWFTEGATGAEIETLVRTYKKSIALSAGEPIPLIEMLQRFATLNSARISGERRELLFSGTPQMLKALKTESTLRLSNDELGEMVGRDKSTISRQLQKLDTGDELEVV